MVASLAFRWQPINTAPHDTWVLIRGGTFDPCFEPLDDGDEPPCVVAKYEGVYRGVCKHLQGAEEWRFANYDAGIYGTVSNPTEWAPLPRDDVATSVTAVEQLARIFDEEAESLEYAGLDSETDAAAAAMLRVLAAEREEAIARAEMAQAALRTIAGMTPHWAGQTPNEFHMQQVARAALADNAEDQNGNGT